MNDRNYALLILGLLLLVVGASVASGVSAVLVYRSSPVAQTLHTGQGATLRLDEQAYLTPSPAWDTTALYWWLSSDEDAVSVNQQQGVVTAHGLARAVALCMANHEEYMRMVAVQGARQEYALNPSEATLRRMQNLDDEWVDRRQVTDREYIRQFCALAQVTP